MTNVPVTVVNRPATVETPVYKLTALDRCDAKDCGARAYLRATFYGGQLHFCYHHANEYEPGIRASALEVLDERSALLADVKRVPSAGAFA